MFGAEESPKRRFGPLHVVLALSLVVTGLALGAAPAHAAPSSCYTDRDWEGTASNTYDLVAPAGAVWGPFTGGGSARFTIKNSGSVTIRLREEFKATEEGGNIAPHPITVARNLDATGSVLSFAPGRAGSITIDMPAAQVKLIEEGSVFGSFTSTLETSDTWIGEFNCRSGTMTIRSDLGHTSVRLHSTPLTGRCDPGEFPDSRCTPGGVTTTSVTELCRSREGTTFSQDSRNVIAAVKASVRYDYGLTPEETRGWQFDHLVPVSLGGTNAPVNIWPQEHYQEKDRLDYAAWRQVCVVEFPRDPSTAQTELIELQQAFRNGWASVASVLAGFTAASASGR
jgi:hypothetical protein